MSQNCRWVTFVKKQRHTLLCGSPFGTSCAEKRGRDAQRLSQSVRAPSGSTVSDSLNHRSVCHKDACLYEQLLYPRAIFPQQLRSPALSHINLCVPLPRNGLPVFAIYAIH